MARPRYFPHWESQGDSPAPEKNGQRKDAVPTLYASHLAPLVIRK